MTFFVPKSKDYVESNDNLYVFVNSCAVYIKRRPRSLLFFLGRFFAPLSWEAFISDDRQQTRPCPPAGPNDPAVQIRPQPRPGPIPLNSNPTPQGKYPFVVANRRFCLIKCRSFDILPLDSESSTSKPYTRWIF